MFYINGLSNGKGSKADIILEGPNGMALKYSLKFDLKVANNQTEYEALVIRLQLVKEVRDKC